MSNVPSGFYKLALILSTSILLLSLLEQFHDPSQPKPMSHLLSAIYVLTTSSIAAILNTIATLLKAILADEQSAITGIQIWLSDKVVDQQQFIWRVLYSRTVEILGLIVMIHVNFVVISVIVVAIVVAGLVVCAGCYYGVNWLLRNDDV